MRDGPTNETPIAVFRREERDGDTALVVTGEIDLSTAKSFEDQLVALTAAAHSPAYVDLAGVSYIDSSGLGALVRASLAAPTGVTIVLVKPSPQVRRLLQASGLAEDFGIRD